MSSHPRHKTREELDPVKDASFIARIEHSKTCQNWSIIENTCYCGIGTPKVQPDISTPKARKEYVKYWKDEAGNRARSDG